MDFIPLTGEDQLPGIIDRSLERPQVIFKHSTRCNISSIAMNRLQKLEAVAGADFYYLDLIRYRSVSNKLAEIFSVHHESPQVLVIRKGECTYTESHLGIETSELKSQLI